MHLVPGIVDVVFPGHVITGGLHQAGQSAAHCRAPSVAHMERTGGVGAYVFDLDLFPVLGGQVSVILPFVQDGPEGFSQPVFLQVEVQKSGTCDFHFVHAGAVQVFLHRSGDHPGGTVEIPGRLQGEVGGKITKGFLGRYGQDHRGHFPLGQFPCLNGLPDGVGYGLRQYFLHVHAFLPPRSRFANECFHWAGCPFPGRRRPGAARHGPGG